MGMCSNCKKVDAKTSSNGGYCVECYNNLTIEERENILKEHEERKAQSEKDEEINGFFVKLGAGIFAFVVFIMMLPSNDSPATTYGTTKEDTHKKPSLTTNTTHKAKHNTIGCKDPNKVYVAMNKFRKEGISAIPKVNGCMLFFDGAKIDILLVDSFAIKVLYHNPHGNTEEFWVDEEHIK